jgi:hypothetical protein
MEGQIHMLSHTSMLCPPIPNRSQSLGDVTFIKPLASMKLREKFIASLTSSHMLSR